MLIKVVVLPTEPTIRQQLRNKPIYIGNVHIYIASLAAFLRCKFTRTFFGRIGLFLAEIFCPMGQNLSAIYCPRTIFG